MYMQDAERAEESELIVNWRDHPSSSAPLSQPSASMHPLGNKWYLADRLFMKPSIMNVETSLLPFSARFSLQWPASCLPKLVSGAYAPSGTS